MALDLRTARARNSLFWWLLFWLPLLKFWYHAQPEVSCDLRRPTDFSVGKTALDLSARRRPVSLLRMAVAL
ncbi:hypothetical protein [Burkholderia cepacia]|uniref:hypothetical protein n=1 Tax=Burkholderia cepacia TaxID=292 RepID=UPI0007566498|nr:hypothetical protein [Burkholderia cepacia]